MKKFEISSKKSKNGKRKFKVVLHEIYPDNVVDELNEVGTKYNGNGITWIRKHCENALESIKGMSLRCEFLDEERTELCGHGMTDIKDGVPIFENAVVIGTFERGYIDEILTESGEKITACIGVGTIDSSCYNNLCNKLDHDIANNVYPYGSVEIMKKDDFKEIVYQYGYVENGRIPVEFNYSGYALLGVAPADYQAKLVELNETLKEENNTMNEAEIKVLIEKTVTSMMNHTAEINRCKDDYEKQIVELNAALETATMEKNDAIANSEKIQTALDDCKKEIEEAYKKIEGLYEEMSALRDELGKAKAKERIGELNAAITAFSDTEKEYAKAEIEAFTADPVASEINSVVNKIWEGIGKKAKEDAIVAEQNSARHEKSIEDIFSAVEVKAAVVTDTNIF